MKNSQDLEEEEDDKNTPFFTVLVSSSIKQ